MKNLKLALLFATVLFNSNLYAQGIDSNTQATASITPACYVTVDDVAFGDVSMQTTYGSGEVTTVSKIKLLCTKNQPVVLTTNNGVNGAGGGGTWSVGTNFKLQVAEVAYNSSNINSSPIISGWADVTKYSTISMAEQVNRATFGNYNTQEFNSTVNYNPNTNTILVHNYWGSISPTSITNLTDAMPVSYTGGTRYVTWRIVKLDGSLIAVNEAPPAANSYMASGLNRIRYELSTTSNFAVKLSASASNGLTYNQNNGVEQEYNLYGKAFVQAAKPGLYADTNTITIHF